MVELPCGVVSVSLALVKPLGTSTETLASELTVKAAATEPNATPVVSVKPDPVTVTLSPTKPWLELSDAIFGKTKKGVALLALPTHAPHAARLGWRAADVMWRLSGDTATDYNHYSKRAILGAVYASTMAVFLDDESENFADTRAFLARRIDAVMRFEGWKHRRAARSIERPSLARFVGRLRYPGR